MPHSDVQFFSPFWRSVRMPSVRIPHSDIQFVCPILTFSSYVQFSHSVIMPHSEFSSYASFWVQFLSPILTFSSYAPFWVQFLCPFWRSVVSYYSSFCHLLLCLSLSSVLMSILTFVCLILSSVFMPILTISSYAPFWVKLVCLIFSSVLTWWTKTSCVLSSGLMKPHPCATLNHLHLPRRRPPPLKVKTNILNFKFLRNFILYQNLMLCA